MTSGRNICFCSVVLSATLVLAGCSTTTTSKPNEPNAASVKPPAERNRSVAASSPSASSLEALRRGESTATPASSPLKEIYFDFDRYDLRSDARETLKANAGWLKTNLSAIVQIEGHCDERGTTEYNLALGAKRAQAAKDYLVALGVAAERLSTISYGKELPVCTEHTEACWQRNRRDRFVIQSPRPPA